MEAPKNQGIVKRQENAPAQQQKSVKDYLKAYTGEIAKALPSQVGAERFQRICMTALTQNPVLAECTPSSFIGAVLASAQLGLEPNTPLGQAYLIPYAGKCTFQIGYKGMIELARRSGEIAMIKAQTVYENDKFSYELGLNPTLEHIPATGNRGKAIAYYAFYKTKDGCFDFEVMYRHEVEEHRRKYSKARKSPWMTDFDSMAKKTVLKRLLKYAPLSTEVALQLTTDETVKSFDKDDAEAMKEMALVPDEMVIDVEYEEAPGEEEEHAV